MEEFRKDNDSSSTPPPHPEPRAFEQATTDVTKEAYRKWLNDLFDVVSDKISPKLPDNDQLHGTELQIALSAEVEPKTDDFDAVSSRAFTSTGQRLAAFYLGVAGETNDGHQFIPTVAAIVRRNPAGQNPDTFNQVFTEELLILRRGGFSYGVGHYERDDHGELTDDSFGYFADGDECVRASSYPYNHELFKVPYELSYDHWPDISAFAEDGVFRTLQ